jgi:hypothetical protein
MLSRSSRPTFSQDICPPQTLFRAPSPGPIRRPVREAGSRAHAERDAVRILRARGYPAVGQTSEEATPIKSLHSQWKTLRLCVRG